MYHIDLQIFTVDFFFRSYTCYDDFVYSMRFDFNG